MPTDTARKARRWLAVGLLGALAMLFAAAGRWQLERAAVYRTQDGAFDRGGAESALTDPAGVAADPEGLRYRRLRVEGRYVPAHQVLLDNMTHDGRVGYEVLTPFAPLDGSRWLLVNRGWVPAGPDRRELPDVELEPQRASVVGRIDRLPAAALALSSSVPAPHGASTVMSFPTVAELERVLGHRLFDYQLLLDPERDDGYVRDWRPVEGRAARSLSYAGQWFLLAIGAAGTAVVIAGRGRKATRH
jgi:surfeit locus 1 family protein